ncbi:MAG: hypothetical protein KDK55_04310 [Chlamydiia bacterium]|nr:hypothetical protein [Chlamydiia bacterium]
MQKGIPATTERLEAAFNARSQAMRESKYNKTLYFLLIGSIMWIYTVRHRYLYLDGAAFWYGEAAFPFIGSPFLEAGERGSSVVQAGGGRFSKKPA